MNSLLNSASGLVSNTRTEVGTSHQAIASLRKHTEVGRLLGGEEDPFCAFENGGGSGKIAYSSLPDAVDPLLASASSPDSVSPLSVHTPADLHPSKQLSESSRRE
ncbi:hypothetical protein E2320_016777, partial [Naja naja]